MFFGIGTRNIGPTHQGSGSRRDLHGGSNDDRTGNVVRLVEALRTVVDEVGWEEWELLVVDNESKDRTREPDEWANCGP